MLFKMSNKIDFFSLVSCNEFFTAGQVAKMNFTRSFLSADVYRPQYSLWMSVTKSRSRRFSVQMLNITRTLALIQCKIYCFKRTIQSCTDLHLPGKNEGFHIGCSVAILCSSYFLLKIISFEKRRQDQIDRSNIDQSK